MLADPIHKPKRVNNLEVNAEHRVKDLETIFIDKMCLGFVLFTVGEINAPKYNVSRNVKDNEPGNIFTAAYINEPINSADIVVPIMAYVKIAPKLRKKYF